MAQLHDGEGSSLRDFHELSFYTLSHPDTAYFIHQHIVDAYQAQTATPQGKPITLIFSLAGLYLYLEKQFTGKQVQQAHMIMANKKERWPEIELPLHRGQITVAEVLQSPAGPQRDEMIRNWCLSVWETFRSAHPVIRELVNRQLNLS